MGTHDPIRSRKTRGTRRRATGFTLIEILIVVVILGILAAIVVPQFVSASDSARENSVKMDLNRIRTQLEVYRNQHNGAYPTLSDFVDQMTLASDATGATAAVGTSGYQFGPYLMEMPNNPRIGTATISNGAVGSSAWYYDDTTGDFRANDSVESREY
ncbi:MAG: prepilin-type N-terminal cleavage/methylation domain-containing protein [Planctomycetes bacterium]|nr:prepilin-type N-terminal cleavage/methylation domain-containing protein [Planctomycetota bacterium]